MSSGTCEKCGKALTPISIEVQNMSGGGKKPEL
jgi:hypothetical protein